jgi:hypothetical protein
MPMTMAERETCSEIYKAYTGEMIEARYWNEAAADNLALFVNDVVECSHGMGMARAIFPSSTKISWLFLVKMPYHILKNEILISKDYVNASCLTGKAASYKTAIKASMITGKR